MSSSDNRNQTFQSGRTFQYKKKNSDGIGRKTLNFRDTGCFNNYYFTFFAKIIHFGEKTV